MTQKIIAFIKDEISMESIDDIGLDEDLLGTGILVEKEVNHSIPENDMTVENFMTLGRIERYLKELLK